MRLATLRLGTNNPASRPDTYIYMYMRLITIQDTKQAFFDSIAGYLN